MNARGDIARHVVLTGAAHGIGREIALAFSEAGTLLTLVDVNGPELARVAAEIEGLGAQVGDVAVVDLCAADAPERVLERAWESLPVDVLVSSAGIYPSADVMELDADQWDRVQAVIGADRHPQEAQGELGAVLLAVKAPATEQATRWIAARLRPDGWVAPHRRRRTGRHSRRRLSLLRRLRQRRWPSSATTTPCGPSAPLQTGRSASMARG